MSKDNEYNWLHNVGGWTIVAGFVCLVVSIPYMIVTTIWFPVEGYEVKAAGTFMGLSLFAHILGWVLFGIAEATKD